MKKIFLIAAFLVVYLISHSQDAKVDSTNLDEIVFTGTKLPKSRCQLTQKIDILEHKEITRLVIRNGNIGELIQYLPGTSVKVLSRNDANWGAFGGLGPKYCIFMLQGLPIDAFIDQQTIELQAIDRIEMSHGPSSVIYPNYLSQDFAGNQGTLSGTANLILKEKMDGPLTSFSLGYGSYNTKTGQAYHQNRLGNLHLFAGAGFEQSDYTNYGTANSWLNMIKNPEYKKIKVFAGLNFYAGENEKHHISVFVNQALHSGDAGRINRRYDHLYALLNTGYTLKMSNVLTFMAKAGFRFYDRTWEEDNYLNNKDQSLASENGVGQSIIPVDLSFSYKHLGKQLLTIGWDYQWANYETWTEPLNGLKTTGNDARCTQRGIYAQEELVFNKLNIRAGVRYGYIKDKISMIGGIVPENNILKWGPVLWGGGIKYNFEPGLSPFLNVGTGYLAPGLKSIGGTINPADKDATGQNGQLPNYDLTAESGVGFDGGVDFVLPLNSDLTLRGFKTRIDDVIVDNMISQNPSQTQSINAGQVSILGFEISVKQHFNKNLQWFANYTYAKSVIKNNLDPDLDGAEVPFVPLHSANIGLNLIFPFGLQLSPYIRFTGKIYDSSSKSGRQSYNSHELLNLNVLQKIYSKNKFNIDLFTSLYNVTNNKFKMPWQFQDPGFSINGGMKVSF